MSELVSLALVAIALTSLLGGLAWLGARADWTPEARRKAAHIALGLVCAAFPWTFASPWPVWLLATLACSGLGALRLRVFRASLLGTALHSIRRQSWGDLYFPLAVALVFHASAGRWELHVVPVLVLTLADSAGALVGRRLGRHALRMDGARKSLEGSLTFFFIAVLCVALPLGLFAGWAWPLALATALLVAGLAALIEGVAFAGLDNLFIPLLTYAVLARSEGWEFSGVFGHTAFLALSLGTVALFGRRFTALSDAALMGLVLALYLFGSLGGLEFLLGPLALAGLYVFLCHRAPDRATRRHPFAAIVACAAAPLGWLALAPAVAFWPVHLALAAQALLFLLAERGIQTHSDPDVRWLLNALLGGLVSVLDLIG